VGSTNLNPVSWLSNCELDVIVDDDTFARQMEEMYVEDLTNATEIILDAQPLVRRTRHSAAAGGGGSAGRAAAGLFRVSNTIGAMVTKQRKLEPVETRIMLAVAIVLVIVGTLIAVFPRLATYPMAAIAIWFAGALFYRSYCLRRKAKHDASRR
jgi:cardiolipin synthase